MRIAIDITSVDGNKAGIGYYTFELVKTLLREDACNNNYILLTHSKNTVNWLPKDLSCEILEVKSKRPGFLWILKSYFKLKKEKISVLISPSNFTFGIIFKNTIQTIHDLAPIKHPEFFSKKASLMYKLLLNLYLPRAKVVMTTCKSTYDEIVEYYPRIRERLFITGVGLHAWTKKNISEKEILDISKKYNLPRHYFLSVGTLEPRKNHINMIKAYSLFLKTNPDYRYLIIGKKGWFYKEIFEIVKELNLTDKVIFLGYVPEEDLAAIVKKSSGVLMLNFYEGFGLPAIEAYSFKIPLLLSDIKAFKSIFSNDDVIFSSPDNPEEISRSMELLLAGPQKHYNANISEEYSWKKVANSTALLFKLFT
jgi:glycosyltransferase involved in cell wall biosynthesis